MSSQLWSTLPLVGKSGTTATLDDITPGRYTFRVRGMNSMGVWGDYSEITLNLYGKTAPPSDVAGFTVAVNGALVNLTWTPNTDPDIDHYEIRLGDSWDTGTAIVANLKASSFLWHPSQSGNLQFWIKAVDTSGNYSDNAATALLVVTQGTVSGLGQQVVDNNVLLQWTDVPGTFPIDHCEIRKGLTFDTAAVVGTVSGTFATIFEMVSGSYKYWVVPVDAAGLYGTEQGLYAVVSQPPDFVLHDQYALDWIGTPVNCLADGGSFYAPVDTSETYEQHFTAHSWAGPQDQVTAGYPYFFQPGQSSASYVETHDTGALIAASQITLAVTRSQPVGTVSITPTISVSADGSIWTDYVGTYTAFAQNFRYVRIALDFATADNGIMVITGASVTLSVKTKTIHGTVTANSGDSGGTLVDITGEFADVQSIDVSAGGTTPVTVVYDFTDAPNPTGFRVLAFNSTTGARVSSPVSYTVKGV